MEGYICFGGRLHLFRKVTFVLKGCICFSEGYIIYIFNAKAWKATFVSGGYICFERLHLFSEGCISYIFNAKAWKVTFVSEGYIRFGRLHLF